MRGRGSAPPFLFVRLDSWGADPYDGCVKDFDKVWLDEGWREHAACRGANTAIFFSSATEAEAKSICAECPVRQECRDEAHLLKYGYGVFGSESAEERLNISKRSRSRVKL